MNAIERVEAAKQGSLEAFNELVLEYQDLIYQHTYALLGNREGAEDAAQEAFLRAYRSLGSFRGGSFRVWLLRIATNVCYDEMRRWKRMEWLPLSVKGEDSEDMDEPSWLVDTQPLPEESCEQNELRKMLQRQVAALPVKYRTVIELVDMLELDYAEAAQVLNVPIGTIKSRLARAHMQLRGQLNGAPAVMPAALSASPC
ncbi:MAG: sigma-70 family RNA polymerase sigma factor [Chloroflexi bacterium]|nr:sigma-70 family RNA polymerase sigma factor [Chloroflexota bacterium]